VEIHGRVASLLEVGTGFHPELTGRENIYLNGAILGMSKAEIDRKFDEIVEFAEIEKFIDTPVKRYSSGMYVRLAFAVAAHLEPEILLVDEVLAVGDAAFQKKCLGKMGDVAKAGRTVLFVSHNMAAVEGLTRRCLYLREGSLVVNSDTSSTIKRYLTDVSLGSRDQEGYVHRKRHDPSAPVRITKIMPEYGSNPGFMQGDDLVFIVELESKADLRGLRFGITVTDPGNAPVFSQHTSEVIETPREGRVSYRLVIKESRLAPGSYALALSVGRGSMYEGRRNYDLVRPGPIFTVLETSNEGRSLLNWSVSSYGCVVLPVSCLHVEQLPVDAKS
jgi:lipopolysaccharide transport system ATP-binding protein